MPRSVQCFSNGQDVIKILLNQMVKGSKKRQFYAGMVWLEVVCGKNIYQIKYLKNIFYQTMKNLFFIPIEMIVKKLTRYPGKKDSMQCGACYYLPRGI